MKRPRIALAATFPTLLTVPVCCLLAAFGIVPWSLLLALPIPLAVHASIAFVRLRPGPPAVDSGCSNELREAKAREVGGSTSP